MHVGYVQTFCGTYLVQIPDANEWGFALADDEVLWPGGFGWGSWQAVPDDEVPPEIRERLGAVVEAARAEWEKNPNRGA